MAGLEAVGGASVVIGAAVCFSWLKAGAFFGFDEKPIKLLADCFNHANLLIDC